MIKPQILSLAVLVAACASTTSKTEIPEKKRTNAGLYLTAKEAYAMWKADPESVRILDVRTPEEYIHVGHAEMAWNIPWGYQSYDWDAKKERFRVKPDPGFVGKVKRWSGTDDTILVMCRSGTRSAKAVDALTKAGYKRVYTVVDGMEGDMANGRRKKNGWKNAKLPWTYDVDPGKVIVSGSR